jgi:hypothetical protein
MGFGNSRVQSFIRQAWPGKLQEDTMHVVWGLIMAAIGLFMAVCSFTKSDFVVYRLLCARSRILWGDAVHRFYQVVGIVLIVLGVLWASGVTWA